jgi:hypothetical protein
LGIAITLHFYGKGKWILKLALTILIIFSIYLVFLWITRGNNINCGCFGDDIWMSPSASLIKNACLMAAIFMLLRFNDGWSFRYSRIVPISIIIICIALPFIIMAIPGNEPQWLHEKKYRIDLSSLYTAGKQDIPYMDLLHGKHVIAFLSATCPHCQMAAYKMHLMKEKDTTLPFFFVIGGQRDLKDFWNKTQAQNIPYCRLQPEPFVQLAGKSWPAIYFIDNDTVVAQSNYITLDQQQIEDWIRK